MRDASARRAESARALPSNAAWRAAGAATVVVSDDPSHRRSAPSESTAPAKRSMPVRARTSPSVPDACALAPLAASSSVSTVRSPPAVAILARSRSTAKLS